MRGSEYEPEYYTDDAGEIRWRLTAKNGNIIAEGAEGYTTKGSAKRGALAAARRLSSWLDDIAQR